MNLIGLAICIVLALATALAVLLGFIVLAVLIARAWKNRSQLATVDITDGIDEREWATVKQAFANQAAVERAEAVKGKMLNAAGYCTITPAAMPVTEVKTSKTK